MSTQTPLAFPALEALIEVYHRRTNTRLVFKRAGAERSIMLVFRKVLFVNSTEKKDRLELLLATRKLLGKQEILRLAEKARDKGVDFMTMVQREGILKDVALVDVMTQRAKEILSDLVAWNDAEVSVDPRGFAAEPMLPLNLDLLPVLLDGLLARVGADECRRLLGSEDQVPVVLDRPYAVRELVQSSHAALVQTVLSRVDGKRAIVEVLEGLNDESLLPMKVLSALRLLGMIDLPAAAPVQVTPPVTVGGSVEVGVVVATEDLLPEEKIALSNIFEGAVNVLEDEQPGAGELEIVLDEGAPLQGAEQAEATVVIEGRVAEPDANELVAAEVGETTQVQSDFNALLDIDPEEAARLFAAAQERFAQGQIDEALTLYRQAIDKDPANAGYYSALGIALLQERPGVAADTAGAMSAFLEAIKLEPEVAANHFYLGQIHRRRGENDEAARCYEEALRLDPAHHEARRALDDLRGPKRNDSGSGLLRRIFGR